MVEFPETLMPVALQGRRSRFVLAGAILGSIVGQRCGWAAACAGRRDPWIFCRSALRLLARWHVPQCVLVGFITLNVSFITLNVGFIMPLITPLIMRWP